MIHTVFVLFRSSICFHLHTLLDEIYAHSSRLLISFLFIKLLLQKQNTHTHTEYSQSNYGSNLPRKKKVYHSDLLGIMFVGLISMDIFARHQSRKKRLYLLWTNHSGATDDYARLLIFMGFFKKGRKLYEHSIVWIQVVSKLLVSYENSFLAFSPYVV